MSLILFAKFLRSNYLGEEVPVGQRGALFSFEQIYRICLFKAVQFSWWCKGEKRVGSLLGW
jgi:hypothetical protein